jgi:hypothetical protein
MRFRFLPTCGAMLHTLNEFLRMAARYGFSQRCNPAVWNLRKFIIGLAASLNPLNARFYY